MVVDATVNEPNISLKIENRHCLDMGKHDNCVLGDLITNYPKPGGFTSRCLYSLPPVLVFSVIANEIDYPLNNLDISDLLFYPENSVGKINNNRKYLLYAVVHKVISTGKVYLDMLSDDGNYYQYKDAETTQLNSIDKKDVLLLMYIDGKNRIETIKKSAKKQAPFSKPVEKEVIVNDPEANLTNINWLIDYLQHYKIIERNIEVLKAPLTFEQFSEETDKYKIILREFLVNQWWTNDLTKMRKLAVYFSKIKKSNPSEYNVTMRRDNDILVWVVQNLSIPAFFKCYDYFIDATKLLSPLDFFNELFDQKCNLDFVIGTIYGMSDPQLITDARSIIQKYPIPDPK